MTLFSEESIRFLYSFHYYNTTQRHNPEDFDLKHRRHESLKVLNHLVTWQVA